MRITWITHYAELYGANRSMVDLILQLRLTGHAAPSVILPREGPLSTYLTDQGVPWAVVPFVPWMSERRYMGGPHHRLGQWWRYEQAARARARTNTALVPAIVAQLKAWGTQLVHLNSAAVPLGPAIHSAFNAPMVRHVRELPERQYLLHLDSGRRAYGRALRDADRIIAISQAVHADILSYTGPLPNIPIIYNGVLGIDRQAALYEEGRHRWAREAPFTFVIIGLIHPSKGQEEAVQALAILRKSHPEVRLRVIGDGRSERLKETILRTGQQNAVALEGFMPDPFPVLQESHALLMCSRNEAMGRVTVEAMACGLPVIGHASGGTKELVDDNGTGLLYDGGADALAACMARLVEDRDLARKLGDKGAARAAERFSIERYATEVANVHRAVLSRA